MTPILLTGHVYELRVPKYRGGTASGYFDDADKLDAAARAFDGKANVYVTLNPVTPALLARACNRVIERAQSTTADADILTRCWLLIDADPVRPAGISSSDSEHAAALQRAADIRAWLTARGWPRPVLADSGNGAHLLYRIDEPNDAASTQLVKRCLDALALRFNDATVTIDQSVFNAARITKLYGTLAVKGDQTPDRPHRRSRILEVPDAIVPVPHAALVALAACAPEPPTPAFQHPPGATLDVRDFIHRHALTISKEKIWNGGTVYELERCPFNPEHVRSSSILQFRSGAVAFQCFHNSCQQRRWQDLRALLEPDRTRRPSQTVEQQSDPVPESANPEPVVVQLSSIRPELIRWLWPRRLARGKLNLVIGDPGLGKSLLTVDVTARVTTGRAWPDGGHPEIGDVVMLTAEDGLADTLRPRLDHARGDAARVHILRAVRERGQERHLCLARDLPALESVITRTNAALLTIDPLSAYLGEIDSKTDSEVRGTLAPLAALAERTGVAVLGIMHLNKNSQQKAIYRALSSIAFVAAARIVLAVAKDPNEAQRRLLAPVKVNICAPPATLGYRITGDGLLVWETDPVAELDADVLLSTPDEQVDRHSKTEAVEWLKSVLGDTERPANQVIKEAEKVGISKRTLERAKAALNVKQRRIGFGDDGRWLWRLPHTSPLGDQWDKTGAKSLKFPNIANTSPTPQLGEEWARNEAPIDRQSSPLADNGRCLDISTTYVHTSPHTSPTHNLDGGQASGPRAAMPDSEPEEIVIDED